MKITKSQLKQIIKEEMEDKPVDEVVEPLTRSQKAGLHRRDKLSFEDWKAQQKPGGIERPPSLESRITRLERKLEEILQSMKGTQSGATQVELEEQK